MNAHAETSGAHRAAPRKARNGARSPRRGLAIAAAASFAAPAAAATGAPELVQNAPWWWSAVAMTLGPVLTYLIGFGGRAFVRAGLSGSAAYLRVRARGGTHIEALSAAADAVEGIARDLPNAKQLDGAKE